MNAKRTLGVVLMTMFAIVSAAGEIPAQYKVLDWIESTGADAWILTDYTPACTDRIEAKFRVTQPEGKTAFVFNAGGYVNKETNQSFFFGFRTKWTNDNPAPYCARLHAACGSWENTYDQISTTNFLQADDHEFIMDGSTHNLKVDDKTWTMRSRSDEFEVGGPLTLFCDHTVSGAMTPSSSVTPTICRIYNFHIYDKDGREAVNLVPVRNMAPTTRSEMYGLYDTVNCKFYGSCTKSRFLGSDGGQYVVTLNHGDYASDAEAGAALVVAAADLLSGDVLIVDAGRWALSSATDSLKVSNGAVVRGSTGNPRDVVVDGAGEVPCIYLNGVSDVTVADLTLTNGIAYRANANALYGGGIYIKNGGGNLVTNCVVTGCRAAFDDAELQNQNSLVYGAGVYICAASAENRHRIVGTLVENCLAATRQSSKTNSKKYQMYGAGINAQYTDVKQCVIRRNFFDDAASFSGTHDYYGVGLYLNASTLGEECAIYENYATNSSVSATAYVPNRIQGGGAYLAASAVLKHSYIGSNLGWKPAGVYLAANSILEECDVYANDGTKATDSKVGNVLVGAADVRISGCRIENGLSKLDCAGLCVDGASCVVSNCIVRGNTGNATFNGSGANLMLTHSLVVNNVTPDYLFKGNHPGLLVTDCVVTNNNQSKDTAGLVKFLKGTAGKVFRNTLLVDNKFVGGTGSGALSGTTTPLFTWDACTFVHNSMPATLVRSGNLGGTTDMSFIDVRNCCFYGNYNGSTAASIFPSLFASYPDSIHNCFAYNETYAIGANGNVTTVQDPKFANANAGDYSPRASSSLRDAGVKSDWMERATDMGFGFEVDEGVCTFTACGETYTVGCGLTKRQPRARIAGTVPDIGCGEYYSKPGLLLIIW